MLHLSSCTKLGILAFVAVMQTSSNAGELSFNRDIRPILSENRFDCHGQDPNKRNGGLRLDVREEAMKAVESGEIAIVPGKPEASSPSKHTFIAELANGSMGYVPNCEAYPQGNYEVVSARGAAVEGTGEPVMLATRAGTVVGEIVNRCGCRDLRALRIPP